MATTWTQPRIIEAIQQWVAEHGDVPAASDWNPGQAQRAGRWDRYQRFHCGHWPHYTTVVKSFGSWNAGITAAGFEPRRRGRPAAKSSAATSVKRPRPASSKPLDPELLRSQRKGLHQSPARQSATSGSWWARFKSTFAQPDAQA